MEKLRKGKGVPHAHARAAATAEPCLSCLVFSCLVEVETRRHETQEDQTGRDVAHAW